MKLISKFVYNFINSGGWRVVIILGFFGLVTTITAMYMRCGFDWWRFILADLPLFSFCGWALYRVYKIFKISKNNYK